jgi:hypothetical protein
MSFLAALARVFECLHLVALVVVAGPLFALVAARGVVVLRGKALIVWHAGSSTSGGGKRPGMTRGYAPLATHAVGMRRKARRTPPATPAPAFR